jgi:hypothetical protein
MDEALVDQILGARQTGEQSPESDRAHATWLLAEGLVDLPRMRELLPYLTGGGDVYSAQIVGHFDHGGIAARARVTIDATGEKPREIGWIDMQAYGRGFASDMLLGEDRTGALPAPARTGTGNAARTSAPR